MTPPRPPAADASALAAEPVRRRMGALHHRNFVLLWTGLVVSNTGTWMQTVGQGWLVLQITDSALALGVVSLAFAVPMTILPPIGARRRSCGQACAAANHTDPEPLERARARNSPSPGWSSFGTS
ncbi:MAG: MFS transporter [Chloroflexia bacterium]